MPTATDTITAAGKRVLRELEDVGPRIAEHKRELEKLYAKANKLYVRGDRAGLRRTDMARPTGVAEGTVASAAENIRQVIIRDGDG